MGKVYVIRKEESAGLSPNVAVGPGGPSFILGTSPENVDYGKYDEMGGRAGRYARRLGRLGRAGRVLGAGLGGLRSLYDATSSGQPGALTAAAGGGFSGYYGTQGLEQFAADAGARFGRWRDAKNAPPMPDMNALPGGSVAGVTPQARTEAMSMMPSEPMNLGATPPPAPGFQLPVAGVGGVTPQRQSQARNMMPAGPMPGNVTLPPAPGYQPGPISIEHTEQGQAFSEAAPPPSVAPPTTYQSQLPNADPKHPLVREAEKENEAGASSASTDGY